MPTIAELSAQVVRRGKIVSATKRNASVIFFMGRIIRQAPSTILKSAERLKYSAWG